jgi:hypothetical protein
MELTLSRVDHPSKLVRLCGVTPADPYVERCWGPLVGPSVVALVRRTHELTTESRGPARIDCRDLARLLGLHPSESPSRNNPIGRTMRRAASFRLANTDLEAGTFAIHDTVAVLNLRQFRRLPYWAQDQHLAAVDTVVHRLREAGVDPSVLAGRTPLRNGSDLGDVGERGEIGPGAAQETNSDHEVDRQRSPELAAAAHLDRLASAHPTDPTPGSVSL